MTEYIYEGIVLTTIDVVDSPTASSPNRVVFSASTPGRKDDTTATFLHKVRDVVDSSSSSKKSKMLLEAETLTPEEVRKMIIQSKSESGTEQKILFSVHGFNADPRGYLLQVRWIETENGNGRFQKFKLIPVLWPSAGLMIGYYRDKALSSAAGRALRSIVEPANSLGFSKSLLCHSMGNRVLRNFANASYNFDHIFMVAPDVPHDIFHKKYIDGGKEKRKEEANMDDNDPRTAGLRIRDMLTEGKGGKIHVLYNKNDKDLLLSTVVNFNSRLGRTGAPPADGDSDGTCCCNGDAEEIHPDLKDYLVSVDWTDNSPSNSHNYQFDWDTIAYYESFYE